MIDQDWQTILFSILGHAFSENHTKNLTKKKTLLHSDFSTPEKKSKKSSLHKYVCVSRGKKY